MDNRRKIRVLIVDDSIVFRGILTKWLSDDAGIEVVAAASDPYQARDKILECTPDVVTLDVEMPRMNGIDFLRRLMPQYPIPVIVISAVGSNVFDALDAGAVDFVAKPNLGTGQSMASFMREVAVKIKIASTASLKSLNYSKSLKKDIQSGNQPQRLKPAAQRLIAIGASTGGTEAICRILKTFPEDMPGTLIVQHMPPGFTRLFAERLNSLCRMEVREARNGDRITAGLALVAPGDQHMRVIKAGGGYVVECFKGEKVNGHCPSVDVLFHSVSEQAGRDALGIILTGMGYDGAKGLLSMRRSGAVTLGQDERSSVVYGMPKVAFDLGAVEKQAHLEEIPRLISALLFNP